MGFWDNALGVSTAPRPQSPASSHPSMPWFRPEPERSYPHNPQGVVENYSEPPSNEQTALKKAVSARSTQTCPDCGSGNFFKPQGMPNAMEQCYHCGWNPRFAHSTAGAGMPSTAETGPATPARQISTQNNFNPQTIVATLK